MTSVYKHNNSIIIQDGKIGISQNCCCEPCTCNCDCTATVTVNGLPVFELRFACDPEPFPECTANFLLKCNRLCSSAANDPNWAGYSVVSTGYYVLSCTGEGEWTIEVSVDARYVNDANCNDYSGGPLVARLYKSTSCSGCPSENPELISTTETGGGWPDEIQLNACLRANPVIEIEGSPLP
jgi:hypothetical protein